MGYASSLEGNSYVQHIQLLNVGHLMCHPFLHQQNQKNPENHHVSIFHQVFSAIYWSKSTRKIQWGWKSPNSNHSSRSLGTNIYPTLWGKIIFSATFRGGSCLICWKGILFVSASLDPLGIRTAAASACWITFQVGWEFNCLVIGKGFLSEWKVRKWRKG